MPGSQLILSGITPDQLVELFRPLLQQEIKSFKDSQEEKLLSPADTCKLFQPPITKPTLSSWVAKGRLTEYRLGNRVFYKQSEVLASLTTLKRYKS